MTDRLKEYLAIKAAEFGARAADEHLDWMTMLALRFCESPIEKLMLGALMNLRSSRFDDLMQHMGDWVGRSAVGEDRLSAYDCYWGFYPQAKIDRYRVDFLVEFKVFHETEPRFIVIECEGHDFHERTKEQAQRDKSRDRDLAAMGFTVLRFTGSEIHRDPDGCLVQLHDLIDRVAAAAWRKFDEGNSK